MLSIISLQFNLFFSSLFIDFLAFARLFVFIVFLDFARLFVFIVFLDFALLFIDSFLILDNFPFSFLAEVTLVFIFLSLANFPLPLHKLLNPFFKHCNPLRIANSFAFFAAAVFKAATPPVFAMAATFTPLKI